MFKFTVLFFLLMNLVGMTAFASNECARQLSTFRTEEPPSGNEIRRSREHFSKTFTRYGGQVVSEDENTPENITSINCHGYACLVNNLATEQWLEPESFKAILSSSFMKLKSVPLEKTSEIEDDLTLI